MITSAVVTKQGETETPSPPWLCPCPYNLDTPLDLLNNPVTVAGCGSRVNLSLMPGLNCWYIYKGPGCVLGGGFTSWYISFDSH